MATKRQILDDPSSCLNKAADDEPLFVLRAQDMLAPDIVRSWASRLGQKRYYSSGTEPSPKETEAYAVAKAMEAWPNRKVPD